MDGTAADDEAVAEATELMTPPVCGDLLALGDADGGVERDAELSLPRSLELPDAARNKLFVHFVLVFKVQNIQTCVFEIGLWGPL